MYSGVPNIDTFYLCFDFENILKILDKNSVMKDFEDYPFKNRISNFFFPNFEKMCQSLAHHYI